MNAIISMDGLWSIVDSLSVKNKKWLVEKLIQSISASKSSEEDKILTGIVRSLKEAKSGQTLPMDSIWEHL